MRARQPDASGYVRRGDVQVWWERFGDGDPAVLFMGADTIVHSHMWKAQVPWFARRHRVVAFDPVGNGRSTHSVDPAAYAERDELEFALAVLDAAGVQRVAAAGVCTGAGLALQLAAEHPDRVLGVVAINPGLLLAPMHRHHGWPTFDDVLDDDAGWHKENRHHWPRDRFGQTVVEIRRHLTDLHQRALHVPEALGDVLGGAQLELLVELDPALGTGEQLAGVRGRERRADFNPHPSQFEVAGSPIARAISRPATPNRANPAAVPSPIAARNPKDRPGAAHHARRSTHPGDARPVTPTAHAATPNRDSMTGRASEGPCTSRPKPRASTVIANRRN